MDGSSSSASRTAHRLGPSLHGAGRSGRRRDRQIVRDTYPEHLVVPERDDDHGASRETPHGVGVDRTSSQVGEGGCRRHRRLPVSRSRLGRTVVPELGSVSCPVRVARILPGRSRTTQRLKRAHPQPPPPVLTRHALSCRAVPHRSGLAVGEWRQWRHRLRLPRVRTLGPRRVSTSIGSPSASSILAARPRNVRLGRRAGRSISGACRRTDRAVGGFDERSLHPRRRDAVRRRRSHDAAVPALRRKAGRSARKTCHHCAPSPRWSGSSRGPPVRVR